MNACPFLKVPGLHIDGAYAEAMVVPADALVRIPDGVSFAAAALATDCVRRPTTLSMPGHADEGRASGGCRRRRARHPGRRPGQDPRRGPHRGRRPATPPRSTRAVRAGADTGIEVVDGSDPVPEITAAAGGGVEGRDRVRRHARDGHDRDAQPRPRWSAGRGGRGMQPRRSSCPSAVRAVGAVVGRLLRLAPRRPREILALEADDLLDIGSAVSHRVDVVAGVPEGLEQLRAHRDNLNASSWCPRPFAGTLV